MHYDHPIWKAATPADLVNLLRRSSSKFLSLQDFVLQASLNSLVTSVWIKCKVTLFEVDVLHVPCFAFGATISGSKLVCLYQLEFPITLYV